MVLRFFRFRRFDWEDLTSPIEAGSSWCQFSVAHRCDASCWSLSFAPSEPPSRPHSNICHLQILVTWGRSARPVNILVGRTFEGLSQLPVYTRTAPFWNFSFLKYQPWWFQSRDVKSRFLLLTTVTPPPRLRPICGEDLPLPGPLQFLLQVSFNFNSLFNALLVSVRFPIRREMRRGFCCLQRGNCYWLCSSCETELGLMIRQEDLCPGAFVKMKGSYKNACLQQIRSS